MKKQILDVSCLAGVGSGGVSVLLSRHAGQGGPVALKVPAGGYEVRGIDGRDWKRLSAGGGDGVVTFDLPASGVRLVTVAKG